ncbi:potassium channel family protein [Agromyces sp. LHK192]|uniref:potassium channel family protein n=1 Tax=Agromyces sp. LHK192 TaxID=2498704 RepID=UPI000FD745D7|nr:potassium channel family protein [Agromyces sp. LHK192]
MTQHGRRAPVPAPRRDGWEAGTSGVLAVLGVGFVVCYSFFVLMPDAPSAVAAVLGTVLIVVWVGFAVDLVVRVLLTPRGDRVHWLIAHPIAALSVVLPVFRAFQVVSLVAGARYFRRHTADAVRARFLVLAVAYVTVFVYFLALATLHAERDAPGANITTFGDSVWWAIVTLATVGYGDTYPVTTMGRIYATLLMIGGIAIVGVASATVISILNDRIADTIRTHQEAAGESAAAAATEAEEVEDLFAEREGADLIAHDDTGDEERR